MNKTLLTVLAGVLLGLSFTFLRGTVVMFGIIIITGIIIWSFLPESDKGFLIKLFIIGISLRIVVFALWYIISVSQGGYGEIIPDSRLYFLKAFNMIKVWSTNKQLGPVAGERSRIEGHLYVLAFFYKLIGYNPMKDYDIRIFNPVSLYSDKLINCLYGTLTGIPIFYIAKDIFGRQVAKISSILVVFFPSLILWSMTNARDTVNILLLSLIIFLVVRFQKKRKINHLVLLIVSLLLLSTIRSYLIFPLLFVICIYFLSILEKNFKNAISTSLVLILIIVALNTTDYGRKLKNKFFNPSKIIENIYLSNQSSFTQLGSYYKIYDEDLLSDKRINKFKLAKGFIRGFIHFMLVPFPWEISSIMQLYAYPQIIIWYLLLPFVFIGAIFAIRYRFRDSLILIYYLLIISLGFATIEGNIGSAMRHRDLVLTFYLIFGAAGIIAMLDRRRLFEEDK